MAPAQPAVDASHYPWPNQDGWVSDGHGYYQGECTSFAAWAVRSDGQPHGKSPDFLGNAAQWSGASTDATPHVGDVAQWDPGTNTGYGVATSVGHVGYVSAVNSNGTVTIQEYNAAAFHRFGTRDVAVSLPSRYLHF